MRLGSDVRRMYSPTKTNRTIEHLDHNRGNTEVTHGSFEMAGACGLGVGGWGISGELCNVELKKCSERNKPLFPHFVAFPA